jgi:hypothetical protein
VIPAPVVGFLARFWPYIAGALVIGFLLFRLSTMADRLEEKRNELARAEAHIQMQNGAIERMRLEGEAAQARAQAALANAEAANAQQQPVIVNLRESGARVRGAGERCEISETLRNAEGL